MRWTLAVLVYLTSLLNACGADDTRFIVLLANPFEAARIPAPAKLAGMWEAHLDAAGGKIEVEARLSQGPDDLFLVNCQIVGADRTIHGTLEASVSFYAIDDASVGLIRQDQPLDASFAQSLFLIRPFYVLQMQLTDNDSLQISIPSVRVDKSNADQLSRFSCDGSGRILLTGTPEQIRQVISSSLTGDSGKKAVLVLKRKGHSPDQ